VEKNKNRKKMGLEKMLKYLGVLFFQYNGKNEKSWKIKKEKNPKNKEENLKKNKYINAKLLTWY